MFNIDVRQSCLPTYTTHIDVTPGCPGRRRHLPVPIVIDQAPSTCLKSAEVAFPRAEPGRSYEIAKAIIRPIAAFATGSLLRWVWGRLADWWEAA